MMPPESNSVTLNVSLPQPLKQYVDGNVSSGLYGSASEFVREAIREKLQRERAKSGLVSKLLEGLDSGEGIPFSDDYSAKKKAALTRRVGRKSRRA